MPPAAVHALLFASGEPLEKKRLAALLGIKESELALALKVLGEQLSLSGVTLVDTGREIELRTSTEAAPLIKKLYESELSRDLGRASLETLATVAYQKEGVTRGEIDWVRGVNSSASLRTLLMRGLIEGREDEKDRRRIRYSMTTEALAHLGVPRPEALPRYQELVAGSRSAIKDEQEAERAEEPV